MYVCFSGYVHVSTGAYRGSKRTEAPLELEKQEV